MKLDIKLALSLMDVNIALLEPQQTAEIAHRTEVKKARSFVSIMLGTIDARHNQVLNRMAWFGINMKREVKEIQG